MTTADVVRAVLARVAEVVPEVDDMEAFRGIDADALAMEIDDDAPRMCICDVNAPACRAHPVE